MAWKEFKSSLRDVQLAKVGLTSLSASKSSLSLCCVIELPFYISEDFGEFQSKLAKLTPPSRTRGVKKESNPAIYRMSHGVEESIARKRLILGENQLEVS